METMMKTNAFVILASLLLLAACGESSAPAEVVDGENDSFSTGGKADGLIDECTVESILALVNDPAVDVAALKSAGLHSRAASNIIKHRDGADGQPGTSDDNAIDDIRELDDISWVGPKAFEQLVAAVGDIECADCRVENLLSLLNDPATGVATLQGAGVHTRAAKAIIAHRDGVDATPGTNDDDLIESLNELDAISGVGPAALDQLLAAVDSDCVEVDGNVEVEVIFSPQPRESSHLTRVAELIDTAEVSVDVAIYSFRDAGIREALGRAADRGVLVRVIFETANEDRKDPVGTASAALEEQGMDVRYVNRIMHHKFAIIDGPTDSFEAARTGWLVSGSANFSTSAGTRYDENTVITRGNQELLLSFQREFNYLWTNSRDFTAGIDFEKVETISITDEDMVQDPNIEAVFTSDNFQIRNTSAGPSFTRVRGRQAVANRIIGLIEGAQDSIWIASGHMRSRPISEALVAKMAQNPLLDVRIYLDAQEYISSSKQSSQDDDLEECLAEAQTEIRRQNCLESGYYFSTVLREAGADMKFKWYSYRWHYSYAVQMHHKYLIIDGNTVASGSYNLSANAEFATVENLVIYSGAPYQGLVDAFEDNFTTLYDTGEAEGLFETLMDEIENGAGDRVAIVHLPMALRHSQVAAYRLAIGRACSDVNSSAFRRNPERHHSCTRR
jgi:phosphatidylserine/phosphatidylglycerophosphate/cardiolipin synthase-like enzyme